MFINKPDLGSDSYSYPPIVCWLATSEGLGDGLYFILFIFFDVPKIDKTCTMLNVICDLGSDSLNPILLLSAGWRPQRGWVMDFILFIFFDVPKIDKTCTMLNVICDLGSDSLNPILLLSTGWQPQRSWVMDFILFYLFSLMCQN